MVNPMRHKQVARAILEALQMADGYALEKSRLMGFVNDLVKPELQFTEQGVALGLLKDAGLIRKADDPLDPGLELWVITDKGRNYLAGL